MKMYSGGEMYENFREVIVASRNTTPSTMLITSPIKVRFRVISSRRCSEHIAGSRIFLGAAYDVFTWPLKKNSCKCSCYVKPSYQPQIQKKILPQSESFLVCYDRDRKNAPYNKPGTAKVGAISMAQNCRRGNPLGFLKLQLVVPYEKKIEGETLCRLLKIFEKISKMRFSNSVTVPKKRGPFDIQSVAKYQNE